MKPFFRLGISGIAALALVAALLPLQANLTTTRDIRFKSISSNDLINPQSGQNLSFAGQIEIANNVERSGSFTVTWYVDGVATQTENYSLDTSTSVFNSYFSWQATSGTHTISIKADPANGINEVNENNNNGELQFQVGQLSPDQQLLTITTTQAQNVTDTSATIYWQASSASIGQYRYATSTIALAARDWQQTSTNGSPTGNTYGSMAYLNSLQPHTTYYVEVRKFLENMSNTPAGNSVIFTFTTTGVGSSNSALTVNTLVKNDGRAEVFWVDNKYCLHWISNEAAAAALFGAHWDQQILSLSEIPTGYAFCQTLSVIDAPTSATDPDNDGLTNAQEALLGTSSTSADTDSDGLTDGDEVKIYHTNPLNADTDGDGYTDGMEVRSGHDPRVFGRY